MGPRVALQPNLGLQLLTHWMRRFVAASNGYPREEVCYEWLWSTRTSEIFCPILRC